MSDKRVVACNLAAATSVCPAGSKAYLLWTTGNLRHHFLVRSRSGRYVRAWKDATQMSDYRVQTLPREHPRYICVTDYGADAERLVGYLTNQARS